MKIIMSAEEYKAYLLRAEEFEAETESAHCESDMSIFENSALVAILLEGKLHAAVLSIEVEGAEQRDFEATLYGENAPSAQGESR